MSSHLHPILFNTFITHFHVYTYYRSTIACRYPIYYVYLHPLIKKLTRCLQLL